MGLGLKKRAYMEDKQNLLRELNINVNKGDSTSARSLFERLKVTVNRKGKINGAEFDGVRIIIQRGRDWCSRRMSKRFPSSTSLTAW